MTITKNIAAGMAALIVTMGVARFLYTPILPLMQYEQGFDDIRAGALATTNFAGYMLGALIATTLPAGRWKLYSFRFGLVSGLVSTPMMGFPDIDGLFLLSRFLGGIAGALVMISGSSILLQNLPKDRVPGGMGMYFSGIGIGITLTGGAVLFFGPQLGADILWFAAAVFCLPLVILSWSWMPAPLPTENMQKNQPRHIRFTSFILLILLIYFIEGAAYVIDATFLVRMFKTDPLPGALAEFSWIVVGLAAISSTYGWGVLGRRIGYLPALFLAFLIQTIGIALPAFAPTVSGALLGAVLFGATFLGIVALTMSLGGKLMPHHPARLMGLLTLCYSISQMISPFISGWILTQWQDPFLLMWIGAALSLICVFLTGFGFRYRRQISQS